MGSELHVGVIGAGIGGVLGLIAMARVGCKVTVLEAAEQLGEIGAGIQMISLPILCADALTLTVLDSQRSTTPDSARRGQGHWEQLGSNQ